MKRLFRRKKQKTTNIHSPYNRYYSFVKGLAKSISEKDRFYMEFNLEKEEFDLIKAFCSKTKLNYRAEEQNDSFGLYKVGINLE